MVMQVKPSGRVLRREIVVKDPEIVVRTLYQNGEFDKRIQDVDNYINFWDDHLRQAITDAKQELKAAVWEAIRHHYE